MLPKTIQPSRKHIRYPCKYNCGNTTQKKGSRCLECYRKDRKNNVVLDRVHAKTYPCKKCGAPITRSTYCKSCRDKVLRKLGEKRQTEANRRKEANEKRMAEKRRHIKKQVCPKSPDKNHFEIINSDKIGVCKYCGRTKDYKKLQQDYLLKL